MEHLYKIYTVVARRNPASTTQGRDDASPPLQHNTSDSTAAELQELPRQPETIYLAQNGFLGDASADDTTIKPRKLAKLGALTKTVGIGGGSLSRTAPKQTKRQLLDLLLALPPELQLKILSYLDFGDLERLRRSSRFFLTHLSPKLVRSLLRPHFRYHIRYTCRICLEQYWEGGEALVSTDEHDPRFPLSSRCIDCVWRQKGFLVGIKYFMANNAAVYVCRWCGTPVTRQPAWNQPEFHKRCFKRYTKVVFFYYVIGVGQWVVVFIASGLCWHYFRSRAMWVVGVVVAGFIVTLWNFCLNSLRGTIMRTYHFALLLETLIFASWLAPLLELSRINRRRVPHRVMDSYEKAMVVFIMFNLVCRGINMIGNAILLCEYKLWRHKKPHMSPARSAWIHTMEVFMFFVEPQCVEQEYPATWWFSRRRRVPRAQDAFEPIVGIQNFDEGPVPYNLEAGEQHSQTLEQ
ncbi:hypothetical protein MY5147_009425 [Beauveria neobassiana]|uniref:F-box domain-containing protein n=2 Tax=Beauveria bassiana TaxID=176275 RepID=A0A0A2VZZ8_BEABA|nr:hypothetical protein BBAD15_g8381 [Beauveria bassiana D1-5]PQK15850.1 hypothetical protein BB8028_0006g01720 [Beauveria bassiana]